MSTPSYVATPTRSLNAPHRGRARGRRGRVNYSLDDTQSLASTIRNLFANARQEKKPLIARWRRNYLYLRNRPNALGGSDAVTPLVPEIFPIVAAKVGWKIDRRFINTISAAAPLGSQYRILVDQMARDLQATLDATWHVNMEENEITKGLWDAEIYGTAIYKTAWDATLANGMGDAKTTRVDPFTFYPDPAARSELDANYFIEVRTMSLQEVDRRWPGKARLLSNSGSMGWTEGHDEAPDQIGGWTQYPRANPGAISPATVPRYKMIGGAPISASDDPGVTVIEAWLREHTVEDDPDSPLGFKVLDSWRVVVLAGEHILMDEPATNLWSHGSHPYTRYVPHDIGEFWGFSTVELLLPTQASINRMLSALQVNIELVGDPIMVDDTRSGITRTGITNKPGKRLTKTAGSTVEWLSPPQLHPMIPELIRYMLQRMEAVSGLSAVTRGGTQPGRNAQATVDAMQEAAFVRVRMELRQLEYAMRRIGSLKSSLIIENYTMPRTLAIIGPDGTQSTKYLQSRHFLVPGPDGEAPLNYTLLVDAGAATHTSRKVREDLAMQLFAMGAIDQYALLEAVDWPNRFEVFKRIQYQTAAGTFNPPGARQRAGRSS